MADVARERPRRFGIRARIALGFTVIAVAVSGGLAALAYQRTRSVLVEDRQDAATVQTFVNARLVRDGLRSAESDVGELLASLSTANRSVPLLHQADRWYGRSVSVDAADLPFALRRRVADGTASRQRFLVDGRPLLGVGVPIPAIGGEYFEVFPLEDVESTLRTLSAALWTGAGIAAVGVGLIGLLASRRVLQPLDSATTAARQIAAGELATRVDPPADRELVPLVDAFNDMADSLAGRVERDRRFASEVSHELRSPLTSLRTAMDVAVSRLPPLEPRAQVAVDLAMAQLDRFERMTLDLLEISRIDAGVAPTDMQPVDVASCVTGLVADITNGAVPVRVEPGASDITVDVDIDRLEWALSNLLSNAQHHGGGACAVVVGRENGRATIAVDDGGPGVPPIERERVFERFARGAAARGTPGSGLGLALVHEHVRVMGGSVGVGDSPAGGARFTIELPVSGT